MKVMVTAVSTVDFFVVVVVNDDDVVANGDAMPQPKNHFPRTKTYSTRALSGDTDI